MATKLGRVVNLGRRFSMQTLKSSPSSCWPYGYSILLYPILNFQLLFPPASTFVCSFLPFHRCLPLCLLDFYNGWESVMYGAQTPNADSFLWPMVQNSMCRDINFPSSILIWKLSIFLYFQSSFLENFIIKWDRL